jgi:hypothetical protein
MYSYHIMRRKNIAYLNTDPRSCASEHDTSKPLIEDDKFKSIRDDIELVNQSIDADARFQLPPGFSLVITERDNHSLFRALVLHATPDLHTFNHIALRRKVMDHMVNCSANEFTTFMRRVRVEHRDEKYWGKDCVALLTFMGTNINMIPVLATKKTFGLRKLSTPVMSRILDLLCGESQETYLEHMRGRSADHGEYPEIVVVGRILKRRIVILHHQMPHSSMTRKCFEPEGFDGSEEDTIYLMRLEGGHFHGVEFDKNEQIDIIASSMLPSGFSIYRVEGNAHNVFLSLSFLQYGDESEFIWLQTQAKVLTDSRGYEDLVAAGIVLKRHIIVYEHKDINLVSLTTRHIFFDDRISTWGNTFYLLQVSDGRYHALERKQVKVNSSSMETRSRKKSKLM